MVELIDKITFEDVDGTKHTYNIWDSDAARKISEFSMAERRQNIISGDGYNTIYSKLSKWYNDFAPVVWSGSYNDLIDRPTIPVVRDGQLDIQRNGVSVGVFSANASVSRTINILVPEINDNISSPTTLYSSWKIDQLIQQLGPNIITPPDPSSEIPQSTITQIEEYIINKIENGEVEIPSSEQQIDYNTINAYIDDSVGSAVKNGKLYITVNGQNVLKVHGGQLLPAIDSYYSANQAEDYDLDLIINDPSDVIDDTTTENGKTWSSQKIHNEIIASGSLRMVVTNERPLVGESNTIYFVKDTTGEENEYTEYAWVGDSWENIGKQVIDLSDYAHHNEIKDSTINIIQNGVVLGSFTLNQSSNLDITIPTPLIGDGTITITQGFDTETVVEGGETVTREVPHVVGTFTVNQGGNTTIDIPKPDEQIQSDWNQSNENAKDFIKNKPQLDIYQVKLVGDNGDVVYHNGSSTFTQKIMYDGGLVCVTQEDVTQCKSYMPTFEEVFRKWKKFAHSGATDNVGKDSSSSDYNAWYYDSANNTIVQPHNSTAYTGFVSPKSYAEYDVTVRVYSGATNTSDDDFIGLVAAFAVDGNGKEHTLSFLRSPKGSGISGENHRWCCVLDYRAQAITSTSNGQAVLVNKNDAITGTYNNWSQSDVGTGSIISISRRGNIITAKCSQFNSSTLDDNTLITIDLDTLSTTYPTLNLFKTKSPWGYSTYSQEKASYENIAIPNDFRIVDLVNNEVSSYNFENSAWETIPEVNPVSEIGCGRISYNNITKKLFYNNGSELIVIAQDSIQSGAQSNWTESDQNSESFIRNKPNLHTVATSGNYNDLNNKPTIPTALSGLTDDSIHRLVTDTEKTTWNSKSDFSGSYNDLTDKPSIPTAQIQADWNQTDTGAADYIKNKPSFIKVVDASALTNGILQTNANVNDLVILTNTSSSVTYTYTNNAGTEKHLKGNTGYDSVFRYCGNGRFQPITLPTPLD